MLLINVFPIAVLLTRMAQNLCELSIDLPPPFPDRSLPYLPSPFVSCCDTEPRQMTDAWRTVMRLQFECVLLDNSNELLHIRRSFLRRCDENGIKFTLVKCTQNSGHTINNTASFNI